MTRWSERLGSFALLILVLAAPLHGALYGKASFERYRPLVLEAEKASAPAVRRLLRSVRTMVTQEELVRGSCWHYLDTAFTRAGYPAPRRTVIFASSKRGPYASAALLRPGDWIYHVNRSYHGVEHSGMFIAWIDRARRKALMLSYPGEGRRRPGRYRVYDITQTYRIIRIGAKR